MTLEHILAIIGAIVPVFSAIASALNQHARVAEAPSPNVAKAQGVVDTGPWTEAGIFYHAWADEWNVNFYYMGEDIAAIDAGWDAYMASMDDAAPDITEYCADHKDGFYTFGSTAMGSEASGD